MLKKAALFVIVLLAGVVPANADVRVTMHDGLVTIVAKDATVRQILVEWARVGKTTIVNAERVAGGPISLELTDVPERQALDILLRSISGYIAAPRATALPDGSLFDRILLSPTTVQPRTVSASSAPPPLPQPRPFQLQPAPVELDDQPNPNVNETLPRPANQFMPPPSQPTPAMPTAPAVQPPAAFGAPRPAPGAPIGTSAPGVIIQPSTPPGQPGQPGQPMPPPQPGRF